MSTFIQSYYHIVFSTRNRAKALTRQRRPDLFRYIWGTLKNKRCHLYRINGVDDHIHIFTSLHAKLALADLVKDVKLSTSDWIQREAVFPRFTHWQEGYGAFTHSFQEKDRIIEYIKAQETHHHARTFREEFVDLLCEAGVEFDEERMN